MCVCLCVGRRVENTTTNTNRRNASRRHAPPPPSYATTTHTYIYTRTNDVHCLLCRCRLTRWLAFVSRQARAIQRLALVAIPCSVRVERNNVYVGVWVCVDCVLCSVSGEIQHRLQIKLCAVQAQKLCTSVVD